MNHSFLKSLFTVSLFVTMAFCFSACTKCYNCTKKCGTCVKSGLPTLAGCDGDASVLPNNVDTWKVYLESQGYTCSYNNVVENDVCGSDNKKTFEGKYYTCVSK